MVFFVCETCNETMKKNQVEKHVYKCRQCKAVTCVDCSQTFYGDDYIEHITCVSEAEKYEKTLYKPKVNTKLNPQDAWVELINNATSSSQITKAPVNVRQYLQRIGELSNVPRNKKKFINFAKNSLKLYNDNLLELIWNYLDSFRIDQIKPQQNLTNNIHTTSSNDVIKNIPTITTDIEFNKDDDNDIEVIDCDAEALKKEKKKLKKEKRKRELMSSNDNIDNNNKDYSNNKDDENDGNINSLLVDNNVEDDLIDSNINNDEVKKKKKKKKHKEIENY